MRDSSTWEGRDLFIDALRVAAVLVVVIGHWMTTTVIWDEGLITSVNALSVIPEAHLATWVLQVMPLLFFVGGFANARSLARHGGEYPAYLRTRLTRLLAPTVLFIAVWLTIGVMAQALPLPQPNIAESAADVAALPLWFLGLYVMVVAMAPLLWWAHTRIGWWMPVLLGVGAAIVDFLVYGLGQEGFGVANYAFVWLLPHQLGFFYAEGRLQRLSAWISGAVAAVGLLGLVIAVTAGGYPVSLIGVPGESRWNTDPPSLVLTAATWWLIGLALVAKPWIRAWAARRLGLVRRLNAVVLTMYLWHVSAIAITAAFVYPLGFPRPAIGSTSWWLTRTLWVAVLIPVLALLVRGLRAFEVHRAPLPPHGMTDHRSRYVPVGIGVVLLAMGILGFSVTGFDSVASEVGDSVLAFSANPLQGALHLAVGLALVGAAYGRGPGGLMTAAASLLYVFLGMAGWSAGIALFAMNPATARLLTVVGFLGLLLLALATAADRKRAVQRPARG